MSISLKNYLLEQLHKYEENHDYQVAAETIKCWIDLYEELPQLIDSQASELPSVAELKIKIKSLSEREEEDFKYKASGILMNLGSWYNSIASPILASRDARIKELEMQLSLAEVYIEELNEFKKRLTPPKP